MNSSFDFNVATVALRRLVALLLGLSLLVGSGGAGAVQLTSSPRLLQMVDELVAEEGFSRSQLLSLLAQAEFKQSILDAINRPAEKVLEWHEYRQIFVTKKRISRGLEFWQKHEQSLMRAEQEYGVPAQVIAAIIGVETYYGRQKGGHRVVDALATLGASDYRRNDFFLRQLKAFLIISRQEQQNPLDAVGSYAGAFGIPQFIPTSFQQYAIDFDGDGQRDLIKSVADAIGSVANYLARHGWQPGDPVLGYVSYERIDRDDSAGLGVLLDEGYKPHSPAAKLQQMGVTWNHESMPHPQQQSALLALQQENGQTLVAVYQNFYTITRYNHSPLYAMAVFQLSEALREGRQ